MVKLELLKRIDFLITVQRELKPLLPIHGCDIFRQISHTQFEWFGEEAIEEIRSVENVFENAQNPNIENLCINFFNDDDLTIKTSEISNNFNLIFNGKLIKSSKTLNPIMNKAKELIETNLLIFFEDESTFKNL